MSFAGILRPRRDARNLDELEQAVTQITDSLVALGVGHVEYKGFQTADEIKLRARLDQIREIAEQEGMQEWAADRRRLRELEVENRVLREMLPEVKP